MPNDRRSSKREGFWGRPAKERRADRSQSAPTALQKLLETVSEKFGLLGMVLADELGLLVAGSSPIIDTQEMAAAAPLVEKGRRKQPLFGWPLKAWRVSTKHGDLVLCAVGEKASVAAASLHAARGVRRILDSTSW